MNIAIVLARFDSKRLPGKALCEVAGKPLIKHVIDRGLAIPGIDQVVLATSTRDVDDPLVHYAESIGIKAFRGFAEDVAGRALLCAETYKANYLVRLNGDSIFIDPKLLGAGLQKCLDGEYDFVTNIPGRTYPYGISVEIMKTITFARAYQAMQEQEDKEHVTRYLYQNPQNFRVYTMSSDRADLKSARLTVDTPADLETMRKIAALLGNQLERASYVQLAQSYFLIQGEKL